MLGLGTVAGIGISSGNLTGNCAIGKLLSRCSCGGNSLNVMGALSAAEVVEDLTRDSTSKMYSMM